MNELYYGSSECSVWRDTIAPIKAEASSISISDDIIAAALRNIYRRDFNPHTDIEPNLFNAIAHTLNQAVTDGSAQGGLPALGNDPLLHALRHSTDVFSAFKVHRAQNDMAARLLDSNGNLKPFKQWREEVLPIADHQCNNWLETEYNTAIIRARQAANWQQFQAEKDILPNLKWLPSTSPNPGEDHRPFWNTILPVDHPFWNEHRPGDRWNCKCDLTSTDEPPTPVPATVPDGSPATVPGGSPPGNNPQPGLKGNPAKTQAVFSDDHPYFPTDCRHCDFYNPTLKARLATVITARVKDCYHCPYIDAHMPNTQNDSNNNDEQERNREHWQKIKELYESGRFPVISGVGRPINCHNLESGKLCVTGKKLRLLLKHTHTDEQMAAAEYIWNHPEMMHSPIPVEMEDYYRSIGLPEDVMYRKIKKKREQRKVIRYYHYKFSFHNEEWIAHLELTEYGAENIYNVIPQNK